jgi:putative ABC transport system ATP-binding protein
MPAATLECERVTAGYTGREGTTTRVLTDVSFAVPPAGRLIILGRSGSGKSTLLRLLNRLTDPLAGVVRFRGRPLADYDPLGLRREVAFVAQTPVVFEGTVRHNLSIRPRGMPAPEEALLGELIEEVGLSIDFLNRSAEALSVGEKQRVCLARALVSKPSALLLDEPTSALDPQSLGVIAQLVARLAEKHSLAVVTATHQPELVRRLGGTVLLVEHGTARTGVSDVDVASFLEGTA